MAPRVVRLRWPRFRALVAELEAQVGNFSMGELLIVLVILLLVFGASRLPAIGEGLGKAVRNLKRGLSSDDDIDVSSGAPRVREQNQQRSAKQEIEDAEVVEKKG
jgi:sec-independent protein translocase protein TatA